MNAQAPVEVIGVAALRYADAAAWALKKGMVRSWGAGGLWLGKDSRAIWVQEPGELARFREGARLIVVRPQDPRADELASNELRLKGIGMEARRRKLRIGRVRMSAAELGS